VTCLAGYGMISYGMISYGMIWYDCDMDSMVWYGMYGMVHYCTVNNLVTHTLTHYVFTHSKRNFEFVVVHAIAYSARTVKPYPIIQVIA